MIGIRETHSFNYAGVTVNVYYANTGEGLLRHEHSYNHATVCQNGSCKVSLEGRNYVMDKFSQPLDLPANEWHEIEALEDNTIFINIFKEN